jgi:hypothetical protein
LTSKRNGLKEQFIDGGSEMMAMGSKTGYVLIFSDDGAVWTRQFLEASGVFLNIYKDASRQLIHTAVDLRQIKVTGTGGNEISISDQSAGKQIVRIKAYDMEETKIWLECIQTMLTNANAPTSYHTSSNNSMMVIGTDQITECDYNEL